jgi:SAM-dependent methyltransferase
LVGEAQPNKAVEPTAYSVRCAPASGGGSPLAFGVKRHMDVIMTKSDWDYRGLAAECYDLWFGDEPFWDQAFFHDRIRQNSGVALEIACGTGRLLVPFRRDGLVVANVATASSTSVRTEAEHVAAAGVRQVAR